MQIGHARPPQPRRELVPERVFSLAPAVLEDVG
jgi:hypothetical protein